MSQNKSVELYSRIVELYSTCGSQKGVAIALGISDAVVHKVLVSEGIIESDVVEQIERLQIEGLSNAEIAKRLGVSTSCVNVNIPYRRGTYLNNDRSEMAEYMRQYRKKRKKESKQARIEQLQTERARLTERLAKIDAELKAMNQEEEL